MIGAKYRVLASAAAVLLAATACASEDDSGTTPAGLIKIEAGVAASQSSTALLVGIEHGFFAEEGIDLTIGKAATGAAAVTQLINGQQQVALGGISPVVTAAAAGLPVLIVSGAVADRPSEQGPQYQTIVAADSGITRLRDLEGKKVAVNSLKCCWEFWMREAVAKDGGNPDAVLYIQLSFADQVTALRAHEVDAISTAQPYATTLTNEGFRNIGDSPAVAFDNPNASNTHYYMAKAFVDANPGIVDKWRAALQKSSDYANEHPDETRAAIVKQTGNDPTLVAAAPLPFYTAKIDRDTINKEAAFAVKYSVITTAPDVATYVAP